MLLTLLLREQVMLSSHDFRRAQADRLPSLTNSFSRDKKGFKLPLWIWFLFNLMPKISFKLRLFQKFSFLMPLVIFAHGQ